MSDPVQDMLYRDLQREYSGLSDVVTMMQLTIEALHMQVRRQQQEIQRLEQQLNECRNRV
jgi:predicted  nucleic acid-binding Zn-ribbon protein